MTLKQIVRAAPIMVVAVFLMTASANANVLYNTNAAGTIFNPPGGTLVLTNSLGAAASLTFTPIAAGNTGVPSNIDFGTFKLVCTTCSTQAQGAGSFFNAFTFSLIITDTTDGATGRFTGTSTGGSVWSDVSQISILWSPLFLGPGTTNALTGNFGTTVFGDTNQTLIVAPNSGAAGHLGETTIQGTISSTAIPEPATLGLIGGGLIGLGLLRRKRPSR